MSIKKDLMKEIEQKAKRLKKNRKLTARHASMEDIVADFFEKVESALANSDDHMDFENRLYSITKQLNGRLSGIDRYFKATLHWANEDTDNWKDLQINGISITWSDQYLKDNPNITSKTCYIDIFDSFL